MWLTPWIALVSEYLAKECLGSLAKHFDHKVAAPVGRCLENDLDEKHGAMVAAARSR
jgi:hypothetical protein